MLSAIEQFGPAPGPSAALLPYATAYHLQHQHHHQYGQQHLAYLPSAQSTTIAHFGLLSPPLSSPASVSSLSNGGGGGNSNNNNNNSLSLKSLQQHVGDLKDAGGLSDNQRALLLQQHHSQQQQQQHLHQQQQQQQQHEKCIMSSHEFARPRQGATTISIHAMPLQHLNGGSGGGLKYNCSPQVSYAAQSPPYTGTHTTMADQTGPMNLVTNQAGSGAGCIYANSSPYHYRSPSSSSSSVDIENDDSMSPLTVQHLQQQQQQHARKAADLSMATKVATAPPLFEHVPSTNMPNYPPAAVDYAHLYASRAALYGAPLFSPHHHVGTAIRPHAAYLTALTPSVAVNGSAFPLEYLKAMQNAMTAGMFQQASPTTAQIPHPQAQPQSHQVPSQLPPLSSPHRHSSQSLSSPNPNTTTARNAASTKGSMLALAPPGPTLLCTTSAAATSPNDLRYSKSQKSFETKKDNSHTSSKKYVGGTYLNKVSATAVAAPEAESFFKVPSGKEGSMKHRILTRPAGSTEKPDKPAVMSTYNSTSNFRRGSCIELANGQFRKVEDMRTEDFIKCTERSSHHQLIESTVVKITTTGPAAAVLITFSYDKNRSRADIEVSTEHPFFVYGQGWASCNPELSQTVFGLKCQRLQVGDICISLSNVEKPPQQQKTAQLAPLVATAPNTQPHAKVSAISTHSPPTTNSTNLLNVPVATYPPAVAFQRNAGVSMHLLAPPPPPPAPSLGPSGTVDQHPFAVVDMAEMLALGNQHHHHLTAAAAAHQQQLYRLGGERLSQQHQQHYYKEVVAEIIEPIDTTAGDEDGGDTPSASRKRRWSAPESGICDNESGAAPSEDGGVCVGVDGAEVMRRLHSQPATSADYCKIFVTYAKARRLSTEAYGNLTA